MKIMQNNILFLHIKIFNNKININCLTSHIGSYNSWASTVLPLHMSVLQSLSIYIHIHLHFHLLLEQIKIHTFTGFSLITI